MAATEKKNMWLHSTPGNTPPETVIRKIAASQGIFMPGAPCYISTAGTVKLSDTSDGTGDTHHGFIVGVVDKSVKWPITGALSVNDEVLVSLIDPRYKYIVALESGGTDTAEVQTSVGDQVGLVVSATAGEVGYISANIAETTNVAVKIVDIMSNIEPEFFDLTKTPGYGLVSFLPSVIDVTRS